MAKPSTTPRTRRRKTGKQSNVDMVPIDREQLRQLRDVREWTQEDLAEKTSISVQTISRLERESHVTSTSVLAALAKAFSVPVGLLLGERVGQWSKSLPGNTADALDQFLERLHTRSADVPKFLNSLTGLLARGTTVLTISESCVEKEEEILGIYASMIVCYETGRWQQMKDWSQTLIKKAQGLGRPCLAAVGHAYAAKALRNIGDEEAAAAELNDLPEGAESFTLSRLRGKITQREDSTKDALHKAMEHYTRSQKLLLGSQRGDLICLVEKMKLYRNTASCCLRLASEKEQPKQNLKRAKEAIDQAKKTLAELEGISPYAANKERSFLALKQAQLKEAEGSPEKAAQTALQAYAQAKKEQQKHQEAKVVMYLVHACCKAGYYKRAVTFYAELQKHKGRFTPPLLRMYDWWVQDHEEQLVEYWPNKIENQGAKQPITFDPGHEIVIDESPFKLSGESK